MKYELNPHKYIFVGNRFYVLEKMLKHHCKVVQIFAVKNSFLSQYLENRGIDYAELPDKATLVNELKHLDYDMLVSNGCPYILPITDIKSAMAEKGGKVEFVNVHPSLLPDGKGKSPINAALLYKMRHGVTCHFMDDGIDTGEIISQIEIPITDDISLELLYRLSFMAEGDVFEKALQNNFVPVEALVDGGTEPPIYYSRSEADYLIDKDTSVELLICKVRAFATKGQYAKIMYGSVVLNVISATRISNPYVEGKYKESPDNMVCLTYGDCILIKKEGILLELCIEKPQDGIEQLSALEGKFLFA